MRLSVLDSLGLSATLLFIVSCQNIPETSPQAFKGYPTEYTAEHMKELFADPPAGYGDVPFFWWNGDTLDVERLKEEIDILSQAPVDGFSVSYNHTDPKTDIEANSNGYGLYGHTEEGNPKVFSQKWWDIWDQVSAYSAQKGMGIGLDDYVVAWPGNGQYVDEVLSREDFKNYQGQLQMSLFASDASGNPIGTLPDHVLSVQRKSLDSVYVFHTTASALLHPEYGKRLVDVYFGRFEDKLTPEGRKGMNYFFQDELKYDLTITSWSEDMLTEFQKRKGYDITPFFPALFGEQMEGGIKARLDYAEVLTQLSEERYFKPVYDWHHDRGLVYGCDNLNRGLDPLTYLDYFRAVSWYTAPGNDAPARGSSFRQTKVSSSVAHLYGRPRTWLEAFHSMGWDSNGALLTHQLDHHLIAGGNLVCMHGLYYTTHGGWWEWAPPCFHFRMPYWPHMKEWLKYAERMCFVLSQGSHVCDIAILYPTESMQAYPSASPDVMFDLSSRLSDVGLDYDFIDYQSIIRSSVQTGRMAVSDESYQILILPDTRAMHEKTMEKVLEFQKQGGIVLAVGSIMDELKDSGITFIEDPDAVSEFIQKAIIPDFRAQSNTGKVLHRHVGGRDLYMVMDVIPGDTMYFRSQGKAEKWNAMDGTIKTIGSISDGSVSKLVYDGAEGGSMLVVFSDGEPVPIKDETGKFKASSVLNIDGEWEVDIVPTMNNKWGDYRYPAKDELIGVEARSFSYDMPGVEHQTLNTIYGYAPYFMTAELDASRPFDDYFHNGKVEASWRPYVFSWQYGPTDSPGSQGYHGLKGSVNPGFLILDKGAHQLFKTNVYVPKAGSYQLLTEGVQPDRMLLDDQPLEAGRLTLEEGWHSLLLAYFSTAKMEYELVNMRSAFRDPRPRSMVVFYKDGDGPRMTNQYDVPTASKWYGTPHLEYDASGKEGQKYAFAMESGPGTSKLEFQAHGKVLGIQVDGKDVDYEISSEGWCQVILPSPAAALTPIVVEGVPDLGYQGGAFFVTPVKMTCEGGTLSLGDWGQMGPMRFYSGGVRYKKTFQFDGSWDKAELDLGQVDATCEVRMNSKFVKTLLTSPYKVDVSGFLGMGENTIEVLVYSTLSNHYQSTPSPYRGTPRAGLMGPVSISTFVATTPDAVLAGKDWMHHSN